MRKVVDGSEFGALLSAVRGGVTWAIGTLMTSGDRSEGGRRVN